MQDLIQETSPTQSQSHFEVRGEMCVIPDSADDVVSLDALFQVIIWIGRIPFVRAHLRHEVTPASRECIVGVYVHRMDVHQTAEVIRPRLITIERPVRVVRTDVPNRFVVDDAAIVVFIKEAFNLDFLPGLHKLFRPKGGNPVIKTVLHIIVLREYRGNGRDPSIHGAGLSSGLRYLPLDCPSPDLSIYKNPESEKGAVRSISD